MMKKTFILTACTAVPVVAGCSKQQPERPNIVMIVADDMGFSDLGCYGSEISTPNIDALAEKGLRYSQFYNCARSWPTRASIMTGYYYQSVLRSSAENRPEGWSRAIPHYLRTAGYRTYLSGKWHVVEMPNPCADAGFDRSYVTGYMLGQYTPKEIVDDKPVEVSAEGYDQATAMTERAIDMLRAHKADHAAEPFFLYLTYTSPHFPLHAPQEEIDKYKDRYKDGWDALRTRRLEGLRRTGIADCAIDTMESRARWRYQSDAFIRGCLGPGEVFEARPWDTLTEEQKAFQSMKMSIHAAMVDRMDQEIGRVMAELRKNGQLENTLVIFFSDNGASAEIIVRGDGHDPEARMGSKETHLCLGPGFATAANTPLRRSKIWVHEGGISTPMVVSWPKGIKARGEVRHAPAHVVDLLPTLLELAGGIDPAAVCGSTYPPLHGVSFTPTFRADVPLERDHIYFNHEGNYALRQGEWKIVSSEIDGKVWSLYNVVEDRGETRDLTSADPARLERMAARWNDLTAQYRAQNPHPTKQQLIDGFAAHDTPQVNAVLNKRK